MSPIHLAKDFAMTTASYFKRVWFVTGAARGIGARIVDAALAQGDAVVATSRDASTLEQRFGAQPGLLAVALDVTSEAQSRRPSRPRWRASAASTCWSTTPASGCSVPSKRRAPTKCAACTRPTSSGC